MFSYFTDLQGSQTAVTVTAVPVSLVTLLIYKVLKRTEPIEGFHDRLVTLLIYKVLKPESIISILSIV